MSVFFYLFLHSFHKENHRQFILVDQTSMLTQHVEVVYLKYYKGVLSYLYNYKVYHFVAYCL